MALMKLLYEYLIKMQYVETWITDSYMADFPKPQKKYADTGKNCNIVIAVILTL